MVTLMVAPVLAQPITETDVLKAQKAWGDGIVAIGDAYSNKADYESVTAEIVDALYGYDEATVLFKPTKAAEQQFRLTREEAISYFVTGVVKEDHGFALQPWTAVRFENVGIIIDEASALAMGNYYFTDGTSGQEAKVEYTFGYFRDPGGRLRINLHHSSFPYDPTE